MSDEGRRIDLWLWQARFCKTRALACRLAESGVVRLTRDGRQTRVDKASRAVRAGDELVFAIGSRLVVVRVLALGVRRGPPAEARTLYEALTGDVVGLADLLEDDEARHADAGARDKPPPRH